MADVVYKSLQHSFNALNELQEHFTDVWLRCWVMKQLSTKQMVKVTLSQTHSFPLAYVEMPQHACKNRLPNVF